MIIYSYQTKDKIFEEQKIKVSNCFVSSNLLELNSRFDLIKNLNIQNALRIAELVLSNKIDTYCDSKSIKLNRLNKTFENIYSYLKQNAKFLELFFIDINGSCLLNSLLLSNNIKPAAASIKEITSLLKSYDCVELFSILLSKLTNNTQPSIIKHILQSKDKFYTYLQGAGYSYNTKWQLWNIYIFSDFENYKETGVNKLGEMLTNFIFKYYKYYSEACFENVDFTPKIMYN